MATEPRTLHEVILDDYLQACAALERPADVLAAVLHYLLEHGRYWEPAPRPKGVRRRWGKSFFANAQRALRDARGDRPRDVYVEGAVLLGLNKDQVKNHAWLADPDGRVVEVTLPAPALAYFGVGFSREQVSAWVVDGPYAGSVLCLAAEEADRRGVGVAP
jgi:hypothetical protein